VSHGRRKRDVHTSETKTKEVPLQLAIVVRSLEEQEEIIASQSQISNSNNNNDRSSRRLEASGMNQTIIFNYVYNNKFKMYFTSKIDGLCDVEYSYYKKIFNYYITIDILKYKLYNQTNYQLICFND